MCEKNIPRARRYLKIPRVRSIARLIMDDGEARTEGIFYSAIAYEKPMPESSKPPLLELCTRPIRRLIVYPDTSRDANDEEPRGFRESLSRCRFRPKIRQRQ